MNILQSWLKMPNPATNIYVGGGALTPKHYFASSRPPKGTSLVETARFEPLNVTNGPAVSPERRDKNTNEKAGLSQEETRDAAVNFDAYRILKWHCTCSVVSVISLLQHGFLLGLQTAVNHPSITRSSAVAVIADSTACIDRSPNFGALGSKIPPSHWQDTSLIQLPHKVL